MSNKLHPQPSDGLEGLLEALKAIPDAPKEHACAGFLWAAAEVYRRNTNGNELEFVDVAMRLLAGTLAKLDINAAAAYLDGLMAYTMTSDATKMEAADQLMKASFINLRSALALADTPAEGEG